MVDRFSVLRSPRCARAGLGSYLRRSAVCNTNKVGESICGKARRRRILRALLSEDMTVNDALLQWIDSRKQEQRKALPLLLAASCVVLVLLVQL